MEDYDVAIVGGGPAGSSCAWSLIRSGRRVVIVDKSRFPRDKVCAGWITPEVVDALQLDSARYSQNAVFQPITGFIAAVGESRPVSTTYDHAVSYGIRRCEFDEFLLRRCGATLQLGEPLTALRRHAGQWLLNNTIRAPVLIGAGGHFCPIARSLGAAVGKNERAVTAQEVEFEASEAQAEHCTVSSSMPELYFCDDLKGYAWCFRKGRYFNVGLGREEHHGLADRLNRFWMWLVEQGKVPSAVRPRFRGHAYLTRSNSPRTILEDSVLLIGDAAGLAYSESGEGIRPAVESGLIAAQVVIGAAGDFSRHRLGEYSALLQQRFGARTESPSHDPSTAKAAAARMLMRIPWFVRHVVLERWFLRTNERALVLRGAASPQPVQAA